MILYNFGGGNLRVIFHLNSILQLRSSTRNLSLCKIDIIGNEAKIYCLSGLYFIYIMYGIKLRRSF